MKWLFVGVMYGLMVIYVYMKVCTLRIGKKRRHVPCDKDKISGTTRGESR
jgi:hypothetical protein